MLEAFLAQCVDSKDQEEYRDESFESENAEVHCSELCLALFVR